MSLKSLHTRVTNQRMTRTCVASIFMLCLLSTEVWSNANINRYRFVRQVNYEAAVNYEDFVAATNSYHQPHFTENRSVIVQLFEWKFADVAAECREFLGPQGYAGVQLSPVLEHTVVKTPELNHPWWERYEVVSYRLASRSGDESEFWSMSRICNEHGVRIYADVVLNHMAAPLHFVGVTEADNEDFIVNTLLEANVNISQQYYANVSYRKVDFHQHSCVVFDNAQDAHEIRNCQLNGHPDLDHSRDHVQKHIVKMLNRFIDMGVAGFRIDKAKYIWPIDLKKIFKQVKNLSTEFNFKINARPFVYHDVFDLGLDSVSKTEYSTYGVVSEYLYPAELSNILRGKAPLTSLINWGPALGFMPHEDSLVFIDSHDTQRGLPASLGNNQMLTYKKRFKYIMANVFMLVHPYGAIKRVMSSFYFPDTDINQGPPAEEADEEEIRSPKFNGQKQCTKESGWVCEHRWPQMVNMIKVANYFKVPDNKEESVIYFQSHGPNQVAFCRGHKAFVAINNDPVMDFVKEVYACLEPGMYCDVVTGGKKEGEEECHGKILEINEQGYIKLKLNAADDSDINYEEDLKVEKQQEVKEEEEEESGKIESYGIVVIYVESKISPENENIGNEVDLKDNEDRAETEANQPETNEDNVHIETKKTETSKENMEGDENQSKSNAEEEGSNKDKEGNNDDQEDDNDDPRAAENEILEENNTDQTEETGDEEVIREAKPASAENDVEETVDKSLEENTSNEGDNEDKKLEESVEAKLSSETEVEQKSAKTNKDGTDEYKEEEDFNQSIEKQLPVKQEDENPSEENKLGKEEGDSVGENSNNEKNNLDSIENSNEEENSIPDDLHKQEREPEKDDDIEQENSTNVQEEDVEQLETSTDEGHNQSSNMEDGNVEAEKQIEKPSAEVVQEINDDSNAVTAKIQDIQTAGFLSSPKGDKGSG